MPEHDALDRQVRALAERVDFRPRMVHSAVQAIVIDDVVLAYIASLLADGIVRLLRGLFSRWFSGGKALERARREVYRAGKLDASDAFAFADRLAAEAGPWARSMGRAEYRELVASTKARGFKVSVDEGE